MPEIQSVPPPGEVLYVMDEALDQWEINPFTHVALSLYGERGRIQEIVDRKRPSGRGWALATGAMCEELDLYAHGLAVELSEQTRRAMFAAALLREPPKLDSLAEVLAQWHIEDATIGGALEPYRRGRAIMVDRDGRPTKKLRRKLAAPGVIRRYVKRKCVDTESLPSYRRQAERLRRLPWPESPRDAHYLDGYFIEQSERYELARRERLRRFTVDFTAPRQRVLPRPERKALRRAAEHAAALLGPDMISDFVARRPVILEGQRLDFFVTYWGSIRNSGHGALDIAVMDANNGVKLCGLCLYWEETPAIDQLVALALHVRAGEELSLLSAGNPLNVTPEGAGHPLLLNRLKKQGRGNAILVDSIRPELMGLPTRAQLNVRQAMWNGSMTHRDAELLVRGDYIGKHKNLYLERVIERVWGRDAKRVMQFNREAIA